MVTQAPSSESPRRAQPSPAAQAGPLTRQAARHRPLTQRPEEQAASVAQEPPTGTQLDCGSSTQTARKRGSFWHDVPHGHSPPMQLWTQAPARHIPVVQSALVVQSAPTARWVVMHTPSPAAP
jgi:hypothetical protein